MLPKKLIFVAFLLFLFFLPPQIAWGSWYAQPPEVWGPKVIEAPKEEVFKERYTWSILGDIMLSIITIGQGVPKIVQGPGGPTYSYEGGLFSSMIGVVTNMTAGPPVSSVEYLAYVGSNLGIIKPVYAQGLGFSAFSPLLELWKISRNITYLGFVAVFVIVGFMIMFRRKIDPRTVVTIQDSLPRIVVALILVTFSYAIAGLVVDSGDLTTRLIGNALADQKLIAITEGTAEKDVTKFERLFSANIFTLTDQLRHPGFFVDKLVEGTLQQAFGTTRPEDIPEPIQWILKVPLNFILVIAGIFIAFKIFFSLLGPYVTVVLYVIFAPFMLILSALPGTQFGLGEWLKNLISRVMVFPVVFTLLAISAILYGQPGTVWSVPQKSWGILWAPVTMGRAMGEAVGPLLAFGILFAIPHAAEAVQQVFQIKPGPLALGGEAGLRGLPIIGRFAK